MNLVYDIKDKPRFGQLLLFSLQQLLAIMAATIAVPSVINSTCGTAMTAAAALFGAGMGSIVYLLFTKSSSPVFLGSSFAFIGSMMSAFSGAASMAAGYWGLILGTVMAGLVYVILAIAVKCSGVGWINKLMPPVIIGPTVAIIGLSLSTNAVADLMNPTVEGGSVYVALICGLITLSVTMLASTYGKKMMKLIPFIVGILAGYVAASIFAFIGRATGSAALIVIDYSAFSTMKGLISAPGFTFLMGSGDGITGTYILTLFAAYVPVAFVVFAEHLADHKNLSSIVGVDLLEKPGLTRTLLGDGICSMVGAFFGGCPNTTYGEPIACVAITRNASTTSIWGAAIMCLVFSFITPLMAFLESIPHCVMGGVCIALYGFIAVSGFKMFQTVDLNKNRNLFVSSVIFITGVGGLTVSFGAVTIRTVACALILGILANVMLAKEKDEPAAE
ncbi:MAG TPA: solute carrier family 23 protein [Oscillospiraceae bacterium]|nr:solute carrier family 23 protein [Oscillospiraceae bacterium]